MNYKLLIVLILSGSSVFLTQCSKRERDQSSLNIFGGEEITDKNDLLYRSTVALLLQTPDSLESLCSGTIIGPRLVASAAHCIAGASALPHFIGMGENPVKGKLFKIVHVAYPSSFYEKEPGDFDQSYDFAVFTTEKDFPNEMLPVQLSLTKEIKSGINVNAAGYGYSDLEEKNHTYPAYGKLRAIRKAKTVVKDIPPISIRQFRVDSGSKSSTKGGDSGGPAYEVFENRLKLLGVLSHGGKHGYNFVHTYTNLYYFNNWLRCTLSPTEFSIKDLNEKKDADQYPCNDSSTLISVDNHEANEKKSCEKWQGWSLVKDEKSNYSACLPITKEACTAYADKTKAFHWDEKAKKCKHL